MLAYRPASTTLTGRVILVTGATGGVGRAVAQGLAAHGAQVILSGRSIPALTELCDRIEQAGHGLPVVLPIDLERAGVDDYALAATAIEERFGRLDGVLLNAAMLGDLTPIQVYDPLQWARVMQVNLNGNFLLLRSILPLLAASQDATVVVTTDDLARRARAYWGAYAVSKRALEGLAEVLAEELADTNIRVNCIDPGPVRTRLRAEAFPAEGTTAGSTPESLIPFFVYLSGPASRGYTGCRVSAHNSPHRQPAIPND
ncbi:MAG: YciK family oxidoreductase [Gammaproteobacteria bacterium]|nr:YciK family oxidoreductase [Gammaproteobacteria bacterium]